jgi:hypothetical protein
MGVRLRSAGAPFLERILSGSSRREATIKAAIKTNGMSDITKPRVS